MTYCLARGFGFLQPEPTQVRISTYSKMHRFAFPGERSLVLLSAGNLATSQAVVSQIQRDLEAGESAPIRTANYVSDVADYIGDLIAKESGKIRSATFILRGKSLVTNQSCIWFIPNNHGTTRTIRLRLAKQEISDRIIRPDTPPGEPQWCHSTRDPT